MMHASLLFLATVCFINQITDVISLCNPVLPASDTTISETKAPGQDPLYTIVATDAYVNFKVFPSLGDSPDNFNKYFAFKKAASGNQWLLLQRRVIDIDQEILTKRNADDSLTLDLMINCRNIADKKGTVTVRKLKITPVDEYRPEFKKIGPISVREDFPPFYKVVVNLRTLVQDNDFADAKAELFFSSVPYKDPETDGLSVFRINNANGNVNLSRPLDYDSGERVLYLNASLKTKAQYTVYTVIQFSVTNVNDRPTQFVYGECTTNCYRAHFSTTIDEHDTGVVQGLFSGDPAQDKDQDRIEYSIIGGSPVDYRVYVTMNRTSGAVSLIKKVAFTNFALVNIIIKAKSYSTAPNIQNSIQPQSEDYSIVILWIKDRQFVVPLSPYYSMGGAHKGPTSSYHVLGSLVMIAMVLTMM